MKAEERAGQGHGGSGDEGRRVGPKKTRRKGEADENGGN